MRVPVPSGEKCACLRKPSVLVSFMGVDFIRIDVIISVKYIERLK
jgi:hypothetical protein